MKKGQLCTSKIQAFASLLERINPDDITDNAYCQRYLTHLLHHRTYYLHIYALLLEKATSHLNKPIQQIKLVDYGSGNGLLGLFASYCGFKQVVLHEPDPHFILSSRKIAEALSLSQLFFVEGKETAFQNDAYHTAPDAIVSTDVIEHIYDLNYFIGEVRNKFPHCMHIHTTAANAANPFIVRRLKKLQLQDEYQGSLTQTDDLSFDQAHASFFSMRKSIIETAGTQLSAENIQLLTTHTRGLYEEDIIKAINLFIRKGQLPQLLNHPTNTCHPFTGSWTERLLDTNEYESLFNNYGYGVQLQGGFYNDYSSGLKKTLYYLVNKMVIFTGLRLSPFIIITGTPIN